MGLYPWICSLATLLTEVTLLTEGFFLLAQTVKNTPAMQETQVQSLGWEDPLEKGMTTHSSIFAWKTQ